MKQRIQLILVATGFAALTMFGTTALAAPAADSQQAELLKLLEKMNSRLEKLEKRNAELEKQLSVAPASTAAPAFIRGDRWRHCSGREEPP